MKRLVYVLLIASFTCMADQKSAEKLAVETYNHLVSYEGRLDAAIRSGDKDKFYRFVVNPMMDIRSRWPVPFEGDEYRKFVRCYYALDSFRLYSEERFKAGGHLSESNVTARDYFNQKALCKKSINGKT